MPLLSELFCGCSFPARASSGVALKSGGCASTSESTPRPVPLSARAPCLPACSYEADPSDPIDAQVSWTLLCMDKKLLSSLLMRKICPGEYEVDGRRIFIRNASVGPCSGSDGELIVSEGSVKKGAASAELPLQAYLQQAAEVAASLGGRGYGAPSVARIPQSMRLTFGGEGLGGASYGADQHGERQRSMRIACEQARLRENAAEAYERRTTCAPMAPPIVSGINVGQNFSFGGIVAGRFSQATAFSGNPLLASAPSLSVPGPSLSSLKARPLSPPTYKRPISPGSTTTPHSSHTRSTRSARCSSLPPRVIAVAPARHLKPNCSTLLPQR